MPKTQKDGSYNAGDANYEKKFASTPDDLKAREEQASEAGVEQKDDIKSQETTVKGLYKSVASPKKHTSRVPLKVRLRQTVRSKSAFAFVVVALVGGVFYSSLFAPNILLVNMKDLLSNDLADATTALAAYTPKMIGYKIAKADCGDKTSIKCKLSTMSRAQVKQMQRHGFQVIGTKLEEDNRDDMDKGNDKPESRYQVGMIIFPNGMVAIDEFSYAIAADSSENIRYLANGVWNPRSSYFHDKKFRERIKSRFDLSKTPQVQGNTEDAVNKSFDQAMQGADENVDRTGQGAYSLKTLGSGKGIAGLAQSATSLTAQSANFIGGQCAMYTQGKIAGNAMKRAKETTLARFAMIYLQAADQIKSGRLPAENDITLNVLSSKLAAGMDGTYGGKNATDTTMYRHIVLREPPIPSPLSILFSTQAFDSIAAILPATGQVAATSGAVGGLSGVQGNLMPAPLDLTGKSRDYCLQGETQANKQSVKPELCQQLVAAASGVISAATQQFGEIGRRDCPPPGYHIRNGNLGDAFNGRDIMATSAVPTNAAVMAYINGILTAGVVTWSNIVAQAFTSNTKGLAAGDSLFAGTGVILGDMAMSRGMMPSNVAALPVYLTKKDELQQKFIQQDKYAGKLDPFNIYNKYSFMGTMVRSFGIVASPTADGILAPLSNLLAIIPSSFASLTSQSASAIYNLQPDPFIPTRLMCPDPEYLAIGINADVACNVRYSMNPIELNMQVKPVLDYMLKAHPDLSQKNIQELQARVAAADTKEPVEKGFLTADSLKRAQEASNQPMIYETGENAGKPIPNSEYDKFMLYCVNRQDPWGRTGTATVRQRLTEEEKKRRAETKDNDLNETGDTSTGSQYEEYADYARMAVIEGGLADQDWYTGKKCLEQSEQLFNFRAYTMMCSVDGSFAGGVDCTDKDNSDTYSDDFITSNNILYTSWY